MVQGLSFVVKARQVCVTPEKAMHLFLARMVDGAPESHFAERLPQDIAFQVHFGIIFIFIDPQVFFNCIALSYLIFIPAYKVLRSAMYDIQSLTPCRA